MKAIYLGIAGTLALLFVQCGGSNSSGGGSSAFQSKCQKMCEHLGTAPLLGCGKSQGTPVDVCTPECVKHLTPKTPGAAPEADVSDVECATTAPDCTSWSACGNLL